MFLDFFYLLKKEHIPVSITEYLHLLEALDKKVVAYSVDDFYYLSRTILVKHEKHLDRFDMLFSHYFKNTELIPLSDLVNLPKDWLEQQRVQDLSDEEKALIESLGGLEELRKRFEELLKEQNERHEGGSKWIGTGGTSPFGVGGYNPEGYRVGGEAGHKGHRKAVKVWDKREFRNFDDKVELNTRNLKMALKRLRVFTREGFADELDLDTTIQKTCDNAGYLDLHLVPAKQNRVKVLLFFDVGGTMDDHVEMCSRLFSAAKYEFKHLEYFYFHNSLYETVWKDNTRRYDRISTMDILNKYNRDYKIIIVGDAYMSPYELLYAGGSVEHYNTESSLVWLERLKNQFPYICWLNPNPEYYWQYAESTHILREFFQHKMFPLTIGGLELAMKSLKDKTVKYDVNF